MNIFGLSPYEPVEDFFREVDRAATVLRLYECVVGKDHAGVEEMVGTDGNPLARRWWEEYQEEAPDSGFRGGVLGFALDTVIEQVNATKDAYVSRELWRPPGLADPAKVEERWAFRNLLGAIYLQMYLLLAAGEKAPSTSRKVRSDKRFCSKRCWRQDYYQRKEKDRRKAERERPALVRKAQRLLSRTPRNKG